MSCHDKYECISLDDTPSIEPEPLSLGKIIMLILLAPVLVPVMIILLPIFNENVRSVVAIIIVFVALAFLICPQVFQIMLFSWEKLISSLLKNPPFGGFLFWYNKTT